MIHTHVIYLSYIHIHIILISFYAYIVSTSFFSFFYFHTYMDTSCIYYSCIHHIHMPLHLCITCIYCHITNRYSNVLLKYIFIIISFAFIHIHISHAYTFSCMHHIHMFSIYSYHIHKSFYNALHAYVSHLCITFICFSLMHHMHIFSITLIISFHIPVFFPRVCIS